MPVSIEELAVGSEVTPVVKQMSLERMSHPLMAGSNPIHYDAEFAEKAGLPAPIATGVMSSAFLSEMLTGAFGVRLLMGREMAEETALGGARVLPERLMASGYAFRFRALEPALRHLLPS